MLVEVALPAVVTVYVASSIIYLARLVLGPTVPDRVLALDALSLDLAVFLVVLSLMLNKPVMAFTVIPLVLWIYAVDIYVSKYLEAKEMGE